MGIHDIKVYYDISAKVKVHGQAESDLLDLIRKRFAQKHCGSIALQDHFDPRGKVYLFLDRAKPGLVYYRFKEGSDFDLPWELTDLIPLYVTLHASDHFNFPDEGTYVEGDARVEWIQRKLAGRNPDLPPTLQNTWLLNLTASTVKEAQDFYEDIRSDHAHMLRRYTNSNPSAIPEQPATKETSGAFEALITGMQLTDEPAVTKD